MVPFLHFLELCKNDRNSNGLTLLEAFEDIWLPLFKEFRANGNLASKVRTGNIVLEGLKQYKLSNEEAFFILIHTGSFSSWINQPLRSGFSLDSKCKERYAMELENSLSKLPPHNNELVFRMDSPDGDKEEVFAWFKYNINKVFRVPYFLSTSKDNWGSTDVIWRIKTKNEDSQARDLAYLTNNKSEKEVLFKRNTFFEIKKVHENEGIVDMQETKYYNSAVSLVGQYYSS